MCLELGFELSYHCEVDLDRKIISKRIDSMLDYLTHSLQMIQSNLLCRATEQSSHWFSLLTLLLSLA